MERGLKPGNTGKKKKRKAWKETGLIRRKGTGLILDDPDYSKVGDESLAESPKGKVQYQELSPFHLRDCNLLSSGVHGRGLLTLK